MQTSIQNRGRERNLVKVTNEKDDELALFLEMRRREKENNLLLLPGNNNNNNNSNSDELDASLIDSNNNGNSIISKSFSSMPLQRKTRADEFLNSENDKSDYDWLLTPPATPLFPSLEMDAQKTITSQNEGPPARPTALRSRLANIQLEPASKSNIASKHPTLPSILNSSSIGNKKPSPSGGTKTAPRRSATPTSRSTLPSTTKSSRSSTPSSRATLLSTKPVAPPVRSSTPTRSSARSSTPTARPSVSASKPTARSATPTRQQSNPSSLPSVSGPAARSASASKVRPTSSKNPVPSRGSSPTVKSRPWKPSEMPGFSLDAPPNLRTTVPERPASASRGRPGVPSFRSSSAAIGSDTRPRQQSCSPSRGRTTHANASTNGISISAMSKSRYSDSDKVSPLLVGTKMVERVVNMRKLAPPKQDDRHSMHNNSTGKSLSSDSSGFGRTLSKKSLDMAMRHMDIRRSMQGNLQTRVTNIPASSVYSIRSAPTKSKTTSIADSPLATSSSASSEPSVNNTSVCIDGIENEDIELGSQQEVSSSFSGQGR
ncbi:hypothetical protein FEM48_Zijuj11G0108100 [Ziziphus jujuba var. spinosa]|uniref:Uncharacterized protein n=1 Tax=Ziziphus jujuba var. spinosa TaxID=714518 RepID=A0A978UII3_ZIZJJ|nr:hypothetical protein FEM48_Zijuj11G0108100 [Ziziphus jujuba var. spinosa]